RPCSRPLRPGDTPMPARLVASLSLALVALSLAHAAPSVPPAWRLAAAEEADPTAEEWWQKGNDAYFGRGAKQDHTGALLWYKKAADKGHAAAAFSVGYQYDKGLGVGQDRAEAAKWYQKAADKGNADAAFNLGLLYQSGRGVKQDYAQARKWFEA